MKVTELETPSVLIDLDRMERNIQRMQAHCDALGLNFRAHIKTHKIPEIARLQVEAGAVGIACQKVSEARVFADAGFEDIQIPYNILGPAKTAKLAGMAAERRVTVSADSPEVVDGLSHAARTAGIRLRVMVDLETDIHRTGAPVERAFALARRIDSEPHLHFAGVLLYPSNPTIRPDLCALLDRLSSAGIDVESVSGGGTGAALHAHEMPELTEIRVGTYVFNDWTSVRKGWAALDDCAMHVMATVVSRPSPDRAILDSGSKTLTPETVDGGYGHVVEYPDAALYRLNEEHAFVDLTRSERKPEIGEVVHLVPVHTCAVTNMHNRLYGVRGDKVEVIWPVAARGLVW